ncbi:hypothetical protein BO78DRAFT_387457 [Aspergillus sclerotiicarbonarius CBS 121057]|uniref:Uncharacterized protein n=1 Tax=Aspergillus sclerotiicarbonarius (strain CBS 121057 / IBT 28362) TaxID=1448318 RepID=A0A319EVK7_ASPSB|nr:hypothetical protein BO78DRAFT_387457 [Aspergillus sclerotiicarbonarius CBS 121057]
MYVSVAVASRLPGLSVSLPEPLVVAVWLRACLSAWLSTYLPTYLHYLLPAYLPAELGCLYACLPSQLVWLSAWTTLLHTAAQHRRHVYDHVLVLLLLLLVLLELVAVALDPSIFSLSVFRVSRLGMCQRTGRALWVGGWCSSLQDGVMMDWSTGSSQDSITLGSGTTSLVLIDE